MTSTTGTGHVERSGRRIPAYRVWLTIAVAVLVLAELGARALGPHLAEPLSWPTYEQQHKFSAVERHTSAGTLLLGDSLMDGAGDPAELTSLPGGAFNASLAGETIATLSSWGTKVVTPRLHPKVVVLGFSVNILNANIPNVAVAEQAYSDSRVVHVAEGGGDITDHLDTWLIAHSALYRERVVLRDYFLPSSVFGSSSIYNPPLSTTGWNKAFSPYTMGTASDPVTVAAGKADIQDDLLYNYAVGATESRQLGSLIDTLRRQGSKVILVAMPVTKEFTQLLPGGRSAYNAALARLLTIGRSHHTVTASAGIWANQDFADPAHLNAAGTKLFSTWLTYKVGPVEAAS